MKKKLLTSVICFMVICSLLMSTTFALGPIRIKTNEELLAENVLTPFGNYTLVDTIELYSLSGSVDSYCFNFSPSGYVIVNANDLSVPEFSPISSSPYTDDGTTKNIYAGPLQYFRQSTGDTYVHIPSGTSVIKQNISTTYSR